jgi:hypothetical protein
MKATMLEGLFSQLAAVPLVPPVKNQGEPLQPTADRAVPWVPPVPSQKTKVKTETEISGLQSYPDDRHYCRECQKLINGRCIAQRFRPMDDIPRRCVDFMGCRS